MSDPQPPAWLALDERHAWHPYTQHAIDPRPLPVVAAEGAWLTLADGRRLLDAISSWWCCLHGHGRPELVEALAAQARALDHVLYAGCAHEPAARLAARLVGMAPGGLERCFYSDDGSTAVEVALKIAVASFRRRGAPDRRAFLALEGGYHGDTFGAMAVGDPEPFHRDLDGLLFAVERAPVDAEALGAAARRLGGRLAAIIVEPAVQGAAGMRAVPPAVVRAARRAADETGALLIADEVLTGFGRTGRTFALEHSGVAPDLLCLSKALTGGMLPLAATLASGPLYEAFLAPERGRMLFHGHTYTANPSACAVALASLDLLERERTPERLDAIGARIETSLGAEDLPAGVRIRRFGGIVAAEGPTGGGYAGPGAGRLGAAARTHAPDVLLRPLGGVLYAMPPACTTPDEAGLIARRMAAVLRAVP